MSKSKGPFCACEKFHHFAGNAVQAYIIQFLEKIGAAADGYLYQCRECGARWRKTGMESQVSLSQILNEPDHHATTNQK